MGVFYFFGQYRIDHVHVTQDLEQVSYRCRLAYRVKNLDDPVEQIQRQRLVVLRQGPIWNWIEKLNQSFRDVRFVDILNGLYERIVCMRDHRVGRIKDPKERFPHGELGEVVNLIDGRPADFAVYENVSSAPLDLLIKKPE
jgi:hypothetical protein